MTAHPWEFVATAKVKDKGEVWHYWCPTCGTRAAVWAPKPGSNHEEYHVPGRALPVLDGEPACIDAHTGEVREAAAAQLAIPGTEAER